MTVPSPVKRPASQDETTIFCEVLYNGNNDNVFFFYRKGDEEDEVFSVAELSEARLQQIYKERGKGGAQKIDDEDFKRIFKE